MTKEQRREFEQFKRESNDMLLGKINSKGKREGGIINNQINDVKNTAENYGVGSSVLSVLGKILVGAFLLLGGKK